jgi:hypothetical protein
MRALSGTTGPVAIHTHAERATWAPLCFSQRGQQVLPSSRRHSSQPAGPALARWGANPGSCAVSDPRPSVMRDEVSVTI